MLYHMFILLSINVGIALYIVILMQLNQCVGSYLLYFIVLIGI